MFMYINKYFLIGKGLLSFDHFPYYLIVSLLGIQI